ncbi:hypothetical protein OG423_02660 [Micromonospora zamorensis]|uniref:hypothetical protein n=1 Tax=Micromonospora zamorensis TaxID=709883 RepID=UPI00352A673A|nr:hypothetical protein OG423_02660 [Micromonospora zamorensis]
MTHDFQLNGRQYQIDADTVRARLRGRVQEDVRNHWVDVDGVRWPVKQAFEAATALPRNEFTSHIALRHLRALGFATSPLHFECHPGEQRPPSPTRAPSEPPAGPIVAGDEHLLADAFSTLLTFISAGDLTSRISALEADLNGVDRDAAAAVAAASELGFDVLHAALQVRKHAGRLSDVIHAAVITQVLPLILDDGERVLRRPSLAAGNDPGRLFDLETDRRVAEFKMAVWKGRDTMRKRGVFADLVHLALAGPPRKAQLFVSGPLPIRYLQTSNGSAAWALGRSAPNLRRRFDEKFGSAEMTVRDFTAGPAKHVELIDLTELLPTIAPAIT